MELKGNLVRLAGTGAAMVFGSTLLVGAAASAQAAQTASVRAPQAVSYQVVNGNNSKACLQVTNAHTGTGTVSLGTCDRSAKQKWEISGGVFKNSATGHCLDGNGANVYTKPCNNGGYQKWTTTSGSPKYIRHTQSKGKYLHANGKVGDLAVFKTASGSSSRWVLGQL